MKIVKKNDKIFKITESLFETLKNDEQFLKENTLVEANNSEINGLLILQHIENEWYDLRRKIKEYNNIKELVMEYFQIFQHIRFFLTSAYKFPETGVEEYKELWNVLNIITENIKHNVNGLNSKEKFIKIICKKYFSDSQVPEKTKLNIATTAFIYYNKRIKDMNIIPEYIERMLEILNKRISYNISAIDDKVCEIFKVIEDNRILKSYCDRTKELLLDRIKYYDFKNENPENKITKKDIKNISDEAKQTTDVTSKEFAVKSNFKELFLTLNDSLNNIGIFYGTHYIMFSSDVNNPLKYFDFDKEVQDLKDDYKQKLSNGIISKEEYNKKMNEIYDDVKKQYEDYKKRFKIDEKILNKVFKKQSEIFEFLGQTFNKKMLTQMEKEIDDISTSKDFRKAPLLYILPYKKENYSEILSMISTDIHLQQLYTMERRTVPMFKNISYTQFDIRLKEDNSAICILGVTPLFDTVKAVFTPKAKRNLIDIVNLFTNKKSDIDW